MQSADKARCNFHAIGMGIAKGKEIITKKNVFSSEILTGFTG
jgi:hypothetical protein